MNNKLSPDQLTENKAKLKAQVDSLLPQRIPVDIEPEVIAKALYFYSAFKDDIFDTDTIAKVIEL